MKKLSPSTKKRIVLDWEGSFVSLKPFKSMRLLRRMGPFVQGICLDRDSTNTNYLPTFHVHNLVNQDDQFVSLTLRTPLTTDKGVPDRITLSRHEKDFYEITRTFRKQIPFSLDGPVSINEVLTAYQSYITHGGAETSYPINQYFDIGCLMIWCNRLDQATDFYYETIKLIEGWPIDTTKYMTQRIDDFFSLEKYLNNPGSIKKRIEDVVNSLGFDKLPSINLEA